MGANFSKDLALQAPNTPLPSLAPQALLLQEDQNLGGSARLLKCREAFPCTHQVLG